MWCLPLSNPILLIMIVRLNCIWQTSSTSGPQDLCWYIDSLFRWLSFVIQMILLVSSSTHHSNIAFSPLSLLHENDIRTCADRWDDFRWNCIMVTSCDLLPTSSTHRWIDVLTSHPHSQSVMAVYPLIFIQADRFAKENSNFSCPLYVLPELSHVNRVDPGSKVAIIVFLATCINTKRWLCINPRFR